MVQLQSFGDGTNLEFVTNRVSTPHLAIGIEYPVPIATDSGHPEPTRAEFGTVRGNRPVFVDLRPEPFFNRDARYRTGVMVAPEPGHLTITNTNISDLTTAAFAEVNRGGFRGRIGLQSEPPFVMPSPRTL